MYKLKIDVVEKTGLTSTHYGTSRFEDFAEAMEDATRVRRSLYEDYSNYQIKDYRVDIIPAND